MKEKELLDEIERVYRTVQFGTSSPDYGLIHCPDCDSVMLILGGKREGEFCEHMKKTVQDYQSKKNDIEIANRAVKFDTFRRQVENGKNQFR